MNLRDAIKEIKELLADGQRHGARAPSGELLAFLESASKQIVKAPFTDAQKTTARRRTEPRTRGRERDVSKTIEELAVKLRSAFNQANEFDKLLALPETQRLTKSNVVQLFKRTFEATPRGDMTKPELFDAFRRERIRHVRTRP
jgi:hypothetical protein